MAPASRLVAQERPYGHGSRASGPLHEINTRRSLDSGGEGLITPGQLTDSVSKTYPQPDGIILGYMADLDAPPEGEAAVTSPGIPGQE